MAVFVGATMQEDVRACVTIAPCQRLEGSVQFGEASSFEDITIRASAETRGHKLGRLLRGKEEHSGPWPRSPNSSRGRQDVQIGEGRIQ